MDIRKPKKPKAKKRTLHKKSKKAKKVFKAKARSYISGEDKLAVASPKRVTNDSMTKHRQEALDDAKKFKYPLKHSKHKIAIISSALVMITLLLLSAFSYSLLYKQQSIGDFAYRISRIAPAPVAKVGGSWVSFEKYLFEVRQNAHYLINQENVDFETPEGREALKNLKKASLNRVKENEVVRQLAVLNGVAVSDEEINRHLDTIRETSGVGQDDKTLEGTLRDFYGWGINDLKRVIEGQLLRQKVLGVLDTDTRSEIETLHVVITGGEKTFEAAVAKYSEDALTNEKKGVLGVITRDEKDLPRSLIDAAFALADGEVSAVVETTFGLHIVKRLGSEGEDKINVAHILIKWENLQVFIDSHKEGLKIRSFITL